MKSVGIGIIGIAGYGRNHLASISAAQSDGLCELKAATVRPEDAEPEMEKTLKNKGTRIHRSVQEMLEREASHIQLVAIPTGIPSHRELAITALEAGLHVLCEKPAAGTYDDALLMRDAAKRYDRILAIGFQFIYTKAIQNLKRMALDKTMGRLLEAKTRVLWPRDSKYYGRNGWAGKIKAGNSRIYDSPTQNATSHYLNNMLYVAGPEADSSAYPKTLYGENYRAQRIESADTQFVRLVTETGVDVTFTASHASRRGVGPITKYIFEKGTVTFDASESGESYSVETDVEGVDESLFPYQDPNKNRLDAFVDVFGAINEGRQPLCTIENALPHSLCVQTLFDEACPVRDVAEDYRADVVDETSNTINTVIEGIAKLTESMFEGSKSFSESGAPWAAPGREVEPTRC